MLLALTCLLLAAQPNQAQPSPLPARETRLESDHARPDLPGAPASPAAFPDLSAPVPSHAELPLLPASHPGSGEGDHSDHMSTMWIVMGGMMAVMMVGAGVYFMNQRGTSAAPAHVVALTGPSALAIPVTAPGGR